MNARSLLASLALGLVWLFASPAQASYQPSATWLQRTDDVHVRADASTVQTVHWVIRIDTEAGVTNYAERRLDFSSSLETLDVLEAFTLTPDGKRLVVAPDKIRTMEAFDEGGPEFSDAKVKVVIFQLDGALPTRGDVRERPGGHPPRPRHCSKGAGQGSGRRPCSSPA